MPFYTGDYYRDTRHLSMLQHGAYRQLLDHCWDQKGPLPIDLEKCYRICGAVSKEEQECVRGIVVEFFTQMSDGHYNKRMCEEIRKAEAISTTRAEAGRVGGLAKAAAQDRATKASLASAKQMLASAKQVPVPPQPHSHSPLPPEPQSPPVSGEPPGPPAPAAPSGKVARKRAPKPAPVSAETWTSYSQAYLERYGVEPIRNQTVNAQMAQFVARLGAEEAPGVARFFVGHRHAYYVNAKHSVGAMLHDAEKLRTEWATGNVGYQRDARESDRVAATGSMWEKVAAELNAKGIK
jgi:uncharacterized protein YdaU (DUF1376 family)